MSSQQVSTPTTTATIAPNAPVKVVKEKVVKVVKEKVVKDKVVKEKVVKVVKDKVVKEKKEKVVKDEDEEKKEKKVRAPSLPAKYNRFIQYTYYMLRSLNNAELEKNGELLFDEEKMFEAANVFGEMEVQKAFVEGFLENKGIAKEMRTHVADKKKDEKAAAKQQVLNEKAAAKQRKFEEREAAKKVVADAKAAKKGASKKKTKKEPPVDLVTSLVTLANSSTEEAEQASQEQEEEDEAAEEDELDVKVITIEGKEYLIDESNNLYDNESHAQIGTWDYVTKLITTV
jgi:hypothetical protein